MAGKSQVLSWEKDALGGSKRYHGCFETGKEAERFVEDAKREHPGREYAIEECLHPERRK